MMDLTTAAKKMHFLSSELINHIETSMRRESELREQIRKCSAVLETSADGLDHDKIEMAKTIINIRGTYSRAGEGRASVISDAVKQLSTGIPVRNFYGDLWSHYFGTKDYSGWHGQRSDHEYGYGPRHGSTIFSVGIVDTVRKSRKWADLNPEEIEAAIYYLVNLERVQDAEQKAHEQAAT